MVAYMRNRYPNAQSLEDLGSLLIHQRINDKAFLIHLNHPAPDSLCYNIRQKELTFVKLANFLYGGDTKMQENKIVPFK